MDTTLKQFSTENTSSVSKNFSLYVNGQNLQANAHYTFFKEKEVLMLPVGSISMFLGYQVEYNHKDKYTKIYKSSYFDSDAILIRYSFAENNDLVFFYYSKGSEYYSIDIPPEVINNELFVPVDFFEQVLGCNVTVTHNGNITINSLN
ncbi:MAG TPA: hypothetical protein VIL26_03600 [Clostridia bacterium]